MRAGERATCRLSRHGLSLRGGSDLRLAGAVPSPPGAAELRSGSVLALSPNKWESRHPHPSAPRAVGAAAPAVALSPLRMSPAQVLLLTLENVLWLQNVLCWCGEQLQGPGC